MQRASENRRKSISASGYASVVQIRSIARKRKRMTESIIASVAQIRSIARTGKRGSASGMFARKPRNWHGKCKRNKLRTVPQQPRRDHAVDKREGCFPGDQQARARGGCELSERRERFVRQEADAPRRHRQLGRVRRSHRQAA